MWGDDRVFRTADVSTDETDGEGTRDGESDTAADN